MLAHAKLSKTFWVEVLRTTTNVINRSPSAPLDGDVPQRVWTGKDILVPTSEGVRLSHLHACHKGQMGKVGPEDSAMYIPGIRKR